VQQHSFPWIILQTENNRRRLQDTLKAYRRWLKKDEWEIVRCNLHLPQLVEGFKTSFHLDNEDNKGILRRLITPIQPGVIAFDPLNKFPAGNIGHREGMSATFTAFAELANCGRDGCSLIISHHALTGMAGIKNAYGFNRGAFGRDSKALIGDARSQINLVPAKEEDNSSLAVICAKNNNGPEFQPFGIKLDPASMLFEVDLTFDYQSFIASVEGAPAQQSRKPTPGNILTIVKRLTFTKSELVKEIMQECGCQKSAAYEGILKAEGLTIQRDEHGNYLPF
jgi:hypothetical protein